MLRQKNLEKEEGSASGNLLYHTFGNLYVWSITLFGSELMFSD